MAMPSPISPTPARRRQKIVFVMIDGLGDVSVSELKNKTPLQSAHTPYLDLLAKCGLTGLLDPVEPSLACGSDTAHLSILGYDPRVYYRGRGAFESMGAGLELAEGDIAFKSVFSTLKDSIVVRRCPQSDFEKWGRPLCADLSDVKLPSFPDVQVTLRYATEHRCGVRLRAPGGLSDQVTGTDPLKDGLALLVSRATSNTDAARKTNAIVNELSAELIKRLASHSITTSRAKAGLPSANVVLLRGCASRIKVPSFVEQHGMRAFMIAPTALIAGIGITIGMEIVRVNGATGDRHSNFTAKAIACAKQLHSDSAFEFGFLHVKAIDDSGHMGNTLLRVQLLERVDAMIGTLLQLLREDAKTGYTIVVTGDHSTPVRVRDHSCEPVPFVICALDHTVTDTVAPSDAPPGLVTHVSSASMHAAQARESAPPEDSTLERESTSGGGCGGGDERCSDSANCVPASGVAVGHAEARAAAAGGGTGSSSDSSGDGGGGGGSSSRSSDGDRLRSSECAVRQRQAGKPIDIDAMDSSASTSRSGRTEQHQCTAVDRRPAMAATFRDFIARDACARFDEISVAHGALGRFPGNEVMPLILRFRDAAQT